MNEQMFVLRSIKRGCPGGKQKSLFPYFLMALTINITRTAPITAGINAPTMP
jgi:hypothetical protein